MEIKFKLIMNVKYSYRNVKLNNNARLWYKGPPQENNKGEQTASKILEINTSTNNFLRYLEL